jgi:HSP20 family molecular chaperone IbpA
MPGVKKEEVLLKIENDLLRVKCEKRKVDKQFYLSLQADLEKIEAKLEDGILEVVIPDKEVVGKVIEIK